MRYFFDRKIIVIFLASVFIIFLHYIGALLWVERYIAFVFNPLEKIFFSQAVKISELYTKDDDELILAAENKSLTEQVQTLLQQNISLHILQDENEALRKQLQFYEKYNYQKQLGNVIGKTTHTDQTQFITIDLGSTKGVAVNQPVIAGEGVIIGKVIDVADNISHACIITDKNCHIAAATATSNSLSGITQGDLGLTVNMDFVPQNEVMNIGDIIITSGLEPAIPRGLIVGKVQEIKDEPNNLFKTAVINPEIDLNTISIVSIIIN